MCTVSNEKCSYFNLQCVSIYYQQRYNEAELYRHTRKLNGMKFHPVLLIPSRCSRLYSVMVSDGFTSDVFPLQSVLRRGKHTKSLYNAVNVIKTTG